MNTVTEASVEPIFRIENVSKGFPGVQALTDVSMDIYPGEVHTLLGENGAGKSTLLKAMFGVHHPDSGSFILDGHEVRFSGPAAALHSGLAMVHQEISLVPQMTAVQNVVLGREHGRLGTIDWKEARERARKSLDAIGFTGRQDIPVSQLSVAEQQLIEIARALSVNARIIIFDEPTASLTTQESQRLFSIINTLRSEGHAIVYVSHRLKEVLELSDRVTVLRDGTLVRTLVRREISEESDLVRLMVGRNLEAFGVRGADRQPGETVLQVENFTIPGVLEDVSLTLRAGEVVGLAGMVGAGRTELARAIVGADRVSSGSLTLKGRPLRISHPRQAIEAGIALLPEDRKSQGLELHMTTASNVTLMDPPGKFGFISRSKQKNIAVDALQPLNAKMTPDMLVQKLSGGTQQKVVLARWLQTDCDVFIFDEPTRGIDVGAKAEIHHLMRNLSDQGKAVLMISSDLPEVLAMSDRVLVMCRGRIVTELTNDDITEENVVHFSAAD